MTIFLGILKAAFITVLDVALLISDILMITDAIRWVKRAVDPKDVEWRSLPRDDEDE